MALKDLVKRSKSKSYIIKPLDDYLMSLNSRDNDRRWDINSPSSAGGCPRSIVYSRLGFEADANAVQPRVRRIFDNGTHTHERLQKYMLDCGVLLMDEVPVWNDALQIQGHTDGLLNLGRGEGGILEIKSINSQSFNKLIDAKDEHKLQAQVYLYCLERRRSYLKRRFKDKKALEKYLSGKIYTRFIEKHYEHLKSGNHYSQEEKLQFKIDCHRKADRILYNFKKPLSKMVFLYENKDNQELKEFTVPYDNERVDWLREQYESINKYVEKKEIPDRPNEATSKSCGYCRWCSYKLECWIV